MVRKCPFERSQDKISMSIISRSPGRICLFGEHQDYMSLSVINAAIDLRIKIEGNISNGTGVTVSLPDIGKEVTFDSNNIVYEGKKDYIRSVVKVLKDRGYFDERKVEAVLSGNIPKKAGTSSSSALTVAWTGFVLAARFSGREIDRMRAEIAEIAYLAEVEEFHESGGRQDQYASALGGVNYFTFFDDIKIEKLDPDLRGFVLGDSGEPKDTQKTLKRVRSGQEAGLKELSSFYEYKSYKDIDLNEASEYFSLVSNSVRPYLEAVLGNFDITKKALIEMKKGKIDDNKIASLMNMHHAFLRDNLKVSTKKIENMMDESFKAGALSGKINGSGEGGCMFAYCPGREEYVAEAISKAGGTPFIINVGRGLEVSTSAP